MSTLIGNDGTSYSLTKSKIYTENGWVPAGTQIKQDITIVEGTELNFEIVGGTTEPENPIENTIWVNTSTAITSWVFSSEVPTSPTAGMVWFSTNDSFPMQTFNALKANNITIYLTGCQQYVSGAWVNCTAKIHNSSSWATLWNGELYYLGNEFENITGGWQAVGLAYQYYGDGKWNNGEAAGAPTLVRNANSLTVTQAAESSGVLNIVNNIDLTDYSTLTVNMEATINAYSFNSIVIYKRNISRFEYTSGVTQYDNVDAYTLIQPAPSSSTASFAKANYNIDISGLQGEYVIGYHLKNSNSYAMSTTIHSVALS